MATSKNSKKTISKGKKAVKKFKKSKNKGLIIVVFLIIIACLAFLGYNVYKEKQNYASFISEVEEYFDDYNIPSETTDDLALSLGKYEGSWKSSDENLLSNSGKITRPSYLDGDKTVNLTLTANYSGATFLYNYIKDFLGINDFEKTYSIVIKANEASNKELCEEIISQIVMPKEVYASMNLVNSLMYSEATISWESSNTAVITNDGTINRPSVDTLVSLTVTVNYGSDSISQKYDVLVLANDIIFEEVNDNFDAFDTTTRYGVINSNSISYNQAVIMEDESFDKSKVDPSETNALSNFLKLRSTSENMAYFETVTLNNAKSLSFKYKFDTTQKSENTTFDFYIDLGEGYTLVKQETVLHRDNFETISFDLSEYKNFKLKVVHQNTFSTDVRVLIDDVLITRGITENDLYEDIKVVSNVSKSICLPFTTKYGGSIEWTSNDTSVLTNIGTLVYKPEESKQVTLTAKVKYENSEYTFTYTVNIKGNVTLDAVEIYFIDLGTTGISDCGESIYIKYNEVDILVDAGDKFESTYNGVKNTITAHSEDMVIEYLIATHPDSDHIGSMASVFEDFQVNNLYKFSGEEFTTQKFKALKAAYDSEPNCKVHDIYNDVFNGTEDKFIYITSEIYIEFIDTKCFLNAESNGRSIVFVLNVYGTKVLMTGDADSQSAHKTLEHDYMNYVGDIDILKVVHHGTAEGTDLEYLNVIKPEVAIICNGNYLGNKHGHPSPTVINNLINYASNNSKEIKIYAITGGGLNCAITKAGSFKGETTLEESLIDRNGTIYLRIDNTGYTLSSELNGDNIIDIRDTKYWANYLNVSK